MEIHMRVISINNSQLNIKQNFKGLWGAENKDVIPAYYDTPKGMIYIHDSLNIIKKDYYPFLDETPLETYKVEQELLSKNVHDRKVGNEFTHHVINVLVQKERLPFTAKNYENYISDKLFPLTKNLIEEKLKKANLHMFLKK